MFLKAIPVYPKGLSKEMNTFATFKAAVGSLKGTRLHITAASFYQLWVNGRFVAFGPARTALGYAREDLISLDPYDQKENRIEITVNGAYCKSFDGVRQPSFLQAELRRGDEVIFATGENLAAYEDPRKIRKAPRYSKQRHFEEIWDLNLQTSEAAETEPVLPTPKVIDRVTPYPAYHPVILTQYASRGTLEFDEDLSYDQRKYSGGRKFPADWGDYPEEEIASFPYTWVQRQRQTRTDGVGDLPVTLRAGQYAVLNFGRIECGFFTFSADCPEASDLILAYSEGGSGDCFEFTNMNALNAAEFLLPKGKSDGMTFAPYTGKYVLLAVKSGTVTVNSFGIITYEADTAAVHCPDMGDPVLNAVARGAVRSYAHNAVDLYTDCPSRERAGWLCDSYFTGKTEYYLHGKAPTEAAYLENYRLYENDGTLIDGVLPMCYPGNTEPGNPIKDIPIPSHLPQGRFIPQWTMWYILECADHLLERNPAEDREKFRPSIEKLLKFYGEYENEDGLLERLPSWNFVEWSAANNWTKDVNYPTNFLYAQVLRRVADLYGDESLRQKAEKIAKTAVTQSMKEGMFRDHALRDRDGNLILQDDCSEICQYYAVLFGDVNLDEYPLLRDRILNVFGAKRKEDLPDVEPINAFIGVYLRLEALLKIGAYEQVLTDVREFFGAMEQETGTLWEYREGKGSRDHGFASYALPAMAKAVEGLK